ncbi:MAG: LacI family DNA-binding transcriptional regulator [Acidimicrobiales bacterium]|nr:LacI family DNA-binding transcriptional regulator [Acidimicrobiales bacterium]
MARVTLQTIADQVGVSRMTVSNAFSRPDQLSSELRDQILAVADELGYVGPDPRGRALVRGTSGAVGVLLTDSLGEAFADEVATGFLGAMVDQLAPTGLALTLLASEPQGEAVPARDVAIDGAVVYSCRPRSSARGWLERRGLPLVQVDQDPAPEVPSVNVDDRGGAQAAARHLVELGHRQIAVVTVAPLDLDDEPAVPHPQRERLAGWTEVLDEAGAGPVPVIEAAGHNDTDATRAAGRVLALDPRPTAVLCFSDLLAVALVQAAHREGLVVPGDLSVVGFDDSPVAQRIEPALTTVHQDIASKGRLAAELLTAAIDDRRDGRRRPPRHEQLPTRLVVRDSTAPPR